MIQARPLIHLTLRFKRTGWWTWEAAPESTDLLSQLGLDPAVGTGSDLRDMRATASTMQELASERRAKRFIDGRFLTNLEKKYKGCGWGRQIAASPDLLTLELSLETHAPKKLQLDNVVECAKTWTFLINGTQKRLRWNGRLESIRYSKGKAMPPVVEDPYRPPSHRRNHWDDDCDEVEVRMIKFTSQKGEMAI